MSDALLSVVYEKEGVGMGMNASNSNVDEVRRKDIDLGLKGGS